MGGDEDIARGMARMDPFAYGGGQFSGNGGNQGRYGMQIVSILQDLLPMLTAGRLGTIIWRGMIKIKMFNKVLDLGKDQILGNKVVTTNSVPQLKVVCNTINSIINNVNNNNGIKLLNKHSGTLLHQNLCQSKHLFY